MEGVLFRPGGVYSPRVKDDNLGFAITNGGGRRRKDYACFRRDTTATTTTRLLLFSNNDHLHYYYNYTSLALPTHRRPRITAVMRAVVADGNVAVLQKEDNTKMRKKMMKKRSKLLKGLSGDLTMLLSSSSSSLDGSELLPDPAHLQALQAASDVLLSQLEKMQNEQKELKMKMKEAKAKSRAADCSDKKMKGNKAKLKAADCSSSTSSSESSDSECEREVLDASRLKHKTNAPPPSVKLNEEDLHQQQQQQLPPIMQEREAPALANAWNQARLTLPLSAAVVGRHSLQESDHDHSLLLLGKEKVAGAQKKIEVCMGGKCKRSGAGALLEEFQKVVDASAASVDVVGCKCMGKCRDGPNVRLVSSPPIDGYDDGELLHRHQVAVAGASVVAVADPPPIVTTRRTSSRPSHPLCIGVGLEDVVFIVSKLAGDEFPQ